MQIAPGRTVVKILCWGQASAELAFVFRRQRDAAPRKRQAEGNTQKEISQEVEQRRDTDVTRNSGVVHEKSSVNSDAGRSETKLSGQEQHGFARIPRGSNALPFRTQNDIAMRETRVI